MASTRLPACRIPMLKAHAGHTAARKATRERVVFMGGCRSREPLRRRLAWRFLAMPNGLVSFSWRYKGGEREEEILRAKVLHTTRFPACVPPSRHTHTHTQWKTGSGRAGKAVFQGAWASLPSSRLEAPRHIRDTRNDVVARASCEEAWKLDGEIWIRGRRTGARYRAMNAARSLSRPVRLCSQLSSGPWSHRRRRGERRVMLGGGVASKDRGLNGVRKRRRWRLC
jgi:hypothetical protein